MGIEINLAGAGSPVGGLTGLIWGLDFLPDGARDIELDEPQAEGTFRWVHLNLAHNAARLWLERTAPLPAPVREMMLAMDSHQRAQVDGDVVCCVLHDVQREFEVRHVDKIGVVRVALAPGLMVTARLHPVGSGDILQRRLHERGHVEGRERALDMLVSAIIENVDGLVRDQAAEVQKAEDAWLSGHHPPESRQLLDIRRRLALLHRLLDGMQRVFLRLEKDDDLPEALHPTVEKLSQRLQGLDGDTQGALGQLRQLRDDLELQANQRINQNLYMLSIISALLMPATLVTGIFGMNTGDLPFTGHTGTYVAMGIGFLSSLSTWLFLRGQGFFRQK